MDKEHINTESSIEQLLELMEHSETLSDQQIEELMMDDASKQSYRELMDCRDAVYQEYGKKPDVNMEWMRFTEKHSPKGRRYLWPSLIAVAASVLFILMYSWFTKPGQKEGISVFKAQNIAQHVVLQTSSGRSIVLGSNPQSQAIAPGAQLQKNNDTLELKYGSIAHVETHTVTIPRGQDFKVVLSDGTTVWLNADSRMTYPSKFTGSNRVVKLQGEAYFEVAKDKKHPFIVIANGVKTRVLGTEFNVRNYSLDDSHVTLIRGSVEVCCGKKKFVRIKPGEDAHLLSNGGFKVQQVDVDSYCYWKEGFFYFDNVPFVDVVQTLGRWYNVNVVFYDRSAMNYHLHFLYNRNEGIVKAIELLNKMSKISVTLEGQTICVR